MRMNKKGNMSDILTAMKFLFGVGLIFLISMTIFSNISDKIQTQPSDSVTAQSKTFFSSFNTKYQKALDYGFVIFAMAFLIFSIVMARQVNTNANFLPLAIIFIILTWVVSIMLANVWVTIAAGDAHFTPILANLVFIPFILPNILYYALIYTLLVGLSLYAK